MIKRTAAVKFQKEYSGYGEKEYHFFVLNDIQKDDIVVLDTANGLRLGKVSRFVEASETNYANKYIVQKVDLESYKQKVADEESRSDLVAALEYEVSRASETAYYETLIAESKDAKVIALAKKILDGLSK